MKTTRKHFQHHGAGERRSKESDQLLHGHELAAALGGDYACGGRTEFHILPDVVVSQSRTAG